MEKIAKTTKVEIKGADIVKEFGHTVPVAYAQIGEEYTRTTNTKLIYSSSFVFMVMDAMQGLFPNVKVDDIKSEHIVLAERWVVGNDIWERMQGSGMKQALVDDNSSIVIWAEDGYNCYRIENFAFIDKEDENK